MRQFPAVYRLALLFSSFVFFILVSVFVIFGFLYQSSIEKQLKADFNREMDDVLADHILFKDLQIKFVKDEAATSLRQQLLTANMSAWFGDFEDKPIRAYGLFSVSPTINLEAYQSQLIQARLTKKSQTLTVSWQEKPIRLFVVPLISQEGTVVGTMVLARSLEQLITQYQLMFWIFLVLLAASLIASFGLGIFLANQALRPLRKMAKIVKQIDLDNIQTQIVPVGHPSDAIMELGYSINLMLARIHQASDKQKSFVAHASHELKTPLTRAISSLEVLPPQSLKTQQIIQSVTSELFGMSLLINQLLMMAKLTNGHQNLKSEVIDLGQFFSGLAKKLKPDLDRKNLSLKIDLPAKNLVHLPLEKLYLNLVLTNLVSNAIKYSFKNSSIKIESTRLLNQLEIKIIDTGIGMTSLDLSQATNAFYRNAQTAGLAQGYGIGLALVKQICDLHEIKFILESQQHQGTTAKLIINVLN